MKLAIQKVFFILLSVSTLFSVSFFSNAQKAPQVVVNDETDEWYENDYTEVAIDTYKNSAGNELTPLITRALSMSVTSEDGFTNDFAFLVPSILDDRTSSDGNFNLGAYISTILFDGSVKNFKIFESENEKDIFGTNINKVWWNTSNRPWKINNLFPKLYFTIEKFIFIPILYNSANSQEQIDKNEIDDFAIQYYSFDFYSYFLYVSKTYGIDFWNNASLPSLPVYKIINSLDEELDENLLPFKDFFKKQFDPIYLNPLRDPKFDPESSTFDDYVSHGYTSDIFWAAQSMVYKDGNEYFISVGYSNVQTMTDEGNKVFSELEINTYRGMTYLFSIQLDSDGNLINDRKLYQDPLLFFHRVFSDSGLKVDKEEKLIFLSSWVLGVDAKLRWNANVFLDLPSLGEKLDPMQHFTIISGGDSDFSNHNYIQNVINDDFLTLGNSIYKFGTDAIVDNKYKNDESFYKNGEMLFQINGGGSNKIIDFSKSELIATLPIEKNESGEIGIDTYVFSKKVLFQIRREPNDLTLEMYTVDIEELLSNNSIIKFTKIFSGLRMNEGTFSYGPLVYFNDNKYMFTTLQQSSTFKFIVKKTKISNEKFNKLSGEDIYINEVVDQSKIDAVNNSELEPDKKDKQKSEIYKDGIFEKINKIIFSDGLENTFSQFDNFSWKQSLDDLNTNILNLENKPNKWSETIENYQVIKSNFVFFEIETEEEEEEVRVNLFATTATADKGVDIKEIIGETSKAGGEAAKFSYRDDSNPIEGTEAKKVWWKPEYMEFTAHIKYKESDIYSKLESDLNAAWANYLSSPSETPREEMSKTPFSDEFGFDISKSFPQGSSDETIQFSGNNGEDVLIVSFNSNKDDFSYFSTINIYLEDIVSRRVDSEAVFRDTIKENEPIETGWIKTDDNALTITKPLLDQINLMFSKKGRHFDGEIKVDMAKDTYLDTDNENEKANKINLVVSIPPDENHPTDPTINFDLTIKIIGVQPMDLTVSFVADSADKTLSININNYDVIKKAGKKVVYDINRVVGGKSLALRGDSTETWFDEEKGSIVIDQSKFYIDEIVDISISIPSRTKVEETAPIFATNFNQRRTVSNIAEQKTSNALWIYIGSGVGGLILLLIILATLIKVFKKKNVIKLEKNEILEFKKEYYRNIYIKSIEDISNLDDKEVETIQEEIKRLEFDIVENSNAEEVFEVDDDFAEENSGEINDSDDANKENEEDEEEFDIDSLI